MKNIDLSNILLSLGKSVDKATIDLRKSKLNCELEEVECEIELSVDIDKESLNKDPKNVTPFNFIDVRSAMMADRIKPLPPNLGREKTEKEDKKSKKSDDSEGLTKFKVRALFTTKLFDE